MISIDKHLEKLFEVLREDGHDLFKYVYNKQDFKLGDPVYYSGPYWTDEEPKAAIKALLNGKWLATGEHVYKFEKEFSKIFNLKESIMVNSGSSANLVMIAALKKRFDWKDGDEIIVSCVGFPTTISAIVQNNLKPVFVDISLKDLNWDLQQIKEKITKNTVAVFSSPVLGNAYDIDAVSDICKENNILFIADNCDSLGSKWKDKYLSEYAIASSTSFYPSHHITTGEGGMVSSNDEEIIRLARSFAWWGRDCYCVGSANLLPNGTCRKRFDKWLCDVDEIVDHKYIFANIGYNLKPLDMQGAIGMVQLTKLNEIHEKRRNNKNIIESSLKKISGISIPEEHVHAETSWFGVPIICEDSNLKKRLVEYFEKNKIQTRNYFSGNILLHPGYKHLDDYQNYPNANKVLSHVFFIGCSPSYSKEVLEYIDFVIENFKHNKQLTVISNQ